MIILACLIFCRGVIVDPGHDFFVEDHEVVERTALPTEYNDDYWEKRYCLRVDRIPTFLHAYADTILRTGWFWFSVVFSEYMMPNREISERDPTMRQDCQMARAHTTLLLVKPRTLSGKKH